MQIADGFLRKQRRGDPGVRPHVIAPWIFAPSDVVVYEFGARLHPGSYAAAAEQIDKARRLYNALIGCIRTVHAEMKPGCWSAPARLPRPCRCN